MLSRVLRHDSWRSLSYSYTKGIQLKTRNDSNWTNWMSVAALKGPCCNAVLSRIQVGQQAVPLEVPRPSPGSIWAAALPMIVVVRQCV